MQPALAPGDRKLLIIAGALIAAISTIALLVSPPSTPPSLGIPSTYSADSSGAKAAYLLLNELGYRVERWVRPPEDLPELSVQGNSKDTAGDPARTVLILVDPFIPASNEENLSLRKFVQQGGQVLVTGAMGNMLAPPHALTTSRRDEIEEKIYRAELPAPLTRGAPEISMKANTRWAGQSGYHMRYYGDDEGGAVVVYEMGKGRVVWWANSGPLTNFGLTESSNLMLFLNSIGDPSTTRVLWDEYYHGERQGFWSYLGRTPIPWSMAQVGLVLAAALFTFGRRSGPMRPLSKESRLSPLEFVETLGDLYQRKGGAAEALAVAYQRFRFLLLKRLGLPPAASLQEIQRGVRERLGWTTPGFSETLQRCELGVKDKSLTGARALHLIQELQDYSRRFGLARAEASN
jgi:Domain of unknown function (DUF4350)